MKFVPLGTKILLKLPSVVKQTAGGIYMPETVQQETPNEGVVLSIGPEVEKVVAGQHILFEKYSGLPVSVGEDSLCVVDESHVIGFFEK